MTNKEMTPKERKERVDFLFNRIAFITELFDYAKNDVSNYIEPMVKELWALTQLQNSLGELEHKKNGE